MGTYAIQPEGLTEGKAAATGIGCRFSVNAQTSLYQILRVSNIIYTVRMLERY